MRKVINYMKEDTYKTANTVNFEGQKAWIPNEEDQLRQLMMTGTLGNSFYVTQKKLVEDAVNFLTGQCTKNPTEVAQMAVVGRNEGYIRTVPIMALALLSKTRPDLVKLTFNQVVLTGNDLEDFMNMVKQLDRGFGRSLKTCLKRWLGEKLNPYYAMKYTKQIGRAIRVSRPKSVDPIYDYVLKFHKENVKNFNAALEKYPQLNYYEKTKVAIGDKRWDDAMRWINEYKLDPQALLGAGNVPNETWKALGRQMGVMQYLKELNNLLDRDAIEVEVMKSKLTSDNLKKARVFPFRLYIAYKNITAGKGFQTQAVRNHLASVLDEYGYKYDWGVWGGKKYVIAPDVSGSMTSGSYNPKPCVVAGMLAGFLYKYTQDSLLLPWDGQVRLNLVKPKTDSIISHISSIENANGGSTAMEKPVEYLITNRIPCDVFILVTDSEEWGSSRWGGRGFIEAWKEYKRTYKNAKAVLVRVDPYPQNPFSEDQAKQFDVFQVFGYNDNVVKFIEHCVLRDQK